MINEKTGEELNPYDLSDRLKRESSKEKTIYICKCCYPEKKLQYYFSSDLKLIPCHSEYSKQHDESCRKNEDYQKRLKYANPLQYDEYGKMVAQVYENLFKRPNRNMVEEGAEYRKRRDLEHTEQQRMRLSALVKKLNLEVSYKQACRYMIYNNKEQLIQFKLEKDFSREVYSNAKDVRIANRSQMMAGCTLEDNGVQFFYYRICEIKIRKYVNNEPIDDYFTTLSYDELVEEKKQHQGKFYCSLRDADNQYTDITYDALRIALRQYENTYNNRVLNLEEDIIIGAGYQYDNGRTYLDHKKRERKCGEIDRCTLLLVNKYGIFCESSYEVKCFDVIMDYIMDNKLYNEVKFYKPYSFTKNAYGDAEWLEDGVITVKGCKKVGIVEVFGMMGNEEYREKTELKQKYAKENRDKFVFLTWYPQKESQTELKNKLIRCIESIRKSVYQL